MEHGFIPGLWEEEINVTDFLNLNKKLWKGESLKYQHTLSTFTLYDVLKDKDGLFKYLVSFKEGYEQIYNQKKVLYLDENIYGKYVETSDRKKMIDSKLLLAVKKEERWAFIQPDLCVIPLYGTRHLVKNTKEYLKSLDMQLQTEEWIHRKVSHNRSVEAIHLFEDFALKHGVNVRKPCKNAKEVANALWITTLYTLLENPEVPFSLYSIFTFLDIYLENDIRKGDIDEVAAQRIVDELYCKLAGLRMISKTIEEFDYSIVLESSRISKTTFRLLESALMYRNLVVPFQLIFNSAEFPELLTQKINSLFELGHPFAFSQSLRKRNASNLSLTSTHTFFRKFDDITMFFASFDLYKGLLVAVNGGKDTETNANFQRVKGRLESNELNYIEVAEQFEAFLNYFITLYSEFLNANIYYYDMYHDLAFRHALISNYPYYLINIAYHHVSYVVNVLTAIYENKYEVVRNSKGYIEAIIPLTEHRDENIGKRLNDTVHNYTNRMLFHKNGHYNVVFFAESPFFEEEDKNAIHTLSPVSFSRTSFSGYQLVKKDEFKDFISNFNKSGYTHIRIQKL